MLVYSRQYNRLRGYINKQWQDKCKINKITKVGGSSRKIKVEQAQANSWKAEQQITLIWTGPSCPKWVIREVTRCKWCKHPLPLWQVLIANEWKSVVFESKVGPSLHVKCAVSSKEIISSLKFELIDVSIKDRDPCNWQILSTRTGTALPGKPFMIWNQPNRLYDSQPCPCNMIWCEIIRAQIQNKEIAHYWCS